MAEKVVAEETVESLKAKVANLEEKLKAAEDKNTQYENAYKEQGERYNRLFGLFANNIDYYVMGQKQDN